MKTQKELLNENKELRDKLAAVTQADWFAVALAHVRAEMFGLDNLNAHHLKGAQIFERILVTLAAPDVAETEDLSSGLDHSILETRKPAQESQDHE